VSSSHFAERPDCETARPANDKAKSATMAALRTEFMVHLEGSKQAILLHAKAGRHSRERKFDQMRERLFARGKLPSRPQELKCA
jgi:hypothetical protein